ncbi:GntR family transcriptional regulator [Streptomyces sp. NPDC058818]|uniref:GntR family transcriptional regulator n=1 Tax=Streptomyces sp. NPDC058818 TaxID=3346640 RepID=UPI0036BC8877
MRVKSRQGDRLPTVKHVARQTAVNPNTVLEAYRELEYDDLVAAHPYGEVDCCGERSTSRVISLGAKTRKGGPQKPVPRLV